MSCKSIPQECLRKESPRVSQECLHRVFGVPKSSAPCECPARVSRKGVSDRGFTGVSECQRIQLLMEFEAEFILSSPCAVGFMGSFTFQQKYCPHTSLQDGPVSMLAVQRALRCSDSLRVLGVLLPLPCTVLLLEQILEPRQKHHGFVQGCYSCCDSCFSCFSCYRPISSFAVHQSIEAEILKESLTSCVKTAKSPIGSIIDLNRGKMKEQVEGLDLLSIPVLLAGSSLFVLLNLLNLWDGHPWSVALLLHRFGHRGRCQHAFAWGALWRLWHFVCSICWFAQWRHIRSQFAHTLWS